MKEFLDLLHKHPHYNVSKNIEILKGSKEMVTNFSDAKEKIKRRCQSRKF